MLAINASGGAVANSSQRYKPFGELRVAGSGQPSKYTFTGQYDFMSFGLMDYGQGTRFYSPLLGRFTSPDTVIPNTANPQDWNRYSYVRSNPLGHTDPSGHIPIPLVTGLIGFVGGGLIGGGVDLVNQLITNPGGDVDWGSVASSSISGAVTGGVIGLTGGAGAPLLATVPLAAYANAASGQVGAVIGGDINAKIKGTNPQAEAKALGLGNPFKIGLDATTGGLGPIGSKVIETSIQKGASTLVQASMKTQVQVKSASITVATKNTATSVSVTSVSVKTVSSAPPWVQNVAQNGTGAKTAVVDNVTQAVIAKKAETACQRCK